MTIGFDAKRAYHNTTGLGYYSRTLIHLLANYYPEHQYYLFNPKPSRIFRFTEANVQEVQPGRLADRLLPSLWRSSGMKKDLQRLSVNLYHGLSHEIPVGIAKTGIRSVVTIHDLIHERFPEQYNPVDVKIYSKKFRYACQHADRIIATSRQTKEDMIAIYQTPADKIDICYQSCSPLFAREVSAEEKKRVADRYNLPGQFFLSVGTIIDRKNLLNVCKALFLLREELELPLVVIGSGSGKYYQGVKDFLLQQGLTNKVIFLSETTGAKNDPTYLSTEDLTVIYQLALAMIYPSFYEGFGLPVLEALWSRLPVITSGQSCLPEVGGNAAYYVNPQSAEEIAAAMKEIYTNSELRESMKEKGRLQAGHFSPAVYVKSVMEVYQRVLYEGF
jgi:glycosyltransferase involved in cell wall biosynthesis